MEMSDVAVIGSGAMGAGIAQVAATAGHRVSLVDSIPEAAAAAVDRLASNLAYHRNIADLEARIDSLEARLEAIDKERRIAKGIEVGMS